MVYFPTDIAAVPPADVLSAGAAPPVGETSFAALLDAVDVDVVDTIGSDAAVNAFTMPFFPEAIDVDAPAAPPIVARRDTGHAIESTIETSDDSDSPETEIPPLAAVPVLWTLDLKPIPPRQDAQSAQSGQQEMSSYFEASSPRVAADVASSESAVPMAKIAAEPANDDAPAIGPVPQRRTHISKPEVVRAEQKVAPVAVTTDETPITDRTALPAPPREVANAIVPPPMVTDTPRASGEGKMPIADQQEPGATMIRPEAQFSSASGGDEHTESRLGESPRHASQEPAVTRTAAAPMFSTALAESVARTQPAAEVVTTPASEPAAVDVASQLVQSMRMQMRNGIGEAIVHLKPEHLGEVSIVLKIEQQSVSATLHAESSNVRELVAQQEPALRQGLAEHGLELSQLTVREDDTRSRQQSPQDRPATPRRKTAPSLARFEVTA